MTMIPSTHTVATIAAAFFQWKQDLIAQGWTVGASGDGLSAYGAASDVITSGSSGAGGFNNDSAWMRLVSPSAHEIVIWMNVAAAEVFYGLFTYDGGSFTGGSPSATAIPTATTYTTFASGSFPLGSSMPGGPYDMTVSVDDASPYGAWFTLSQGGTPVFGLAWDPTSSTVAQMAMLDPAPQALVFGAGASFTYGWDESVTARVGLTGGGGGGPADTTAPIVEDFTPTTGSSIARTDTLAVTARDETELATVHLWGELADGTRVVVYDGSGFVGAFATSSTLVDGTYTIEHDAPGWATATLILHVQAVDTSGNTTTASASYTITDAPAAPVVGPFSPSDGGNTTRTGTITIDVTDDEGRTALQNVQIAATLASGQVLAVYNGSAFPGVFAAGSARSNITSGYRYSIVHAGAGWPSSTIVFRVTATDAQGRITTDTSYNLAVTDAPAAPTIGTWSPSAGALSRTDDVSFAVTCADGFASILVWAVLADGTTVMVYDGASLGAQVNAGSSITGTSTSKTITVVCDSPGWTDDYTLHVRATSTLGLTATATQAYTLTDAPAPSTPDTTAPTVTLVAPLGGELARTDPVVVDVTDDVAFAAVFVWVVYPNGTTDVVYDGTNFTASYVGASKQESITDGYRYTLRRAGGWPYAPTVRVAPIDSSGNTP